MKTALVVGVLLALLAPALPAAEPPNIVLVFVDDLGYGDLGSYGHPTIATPRLDRMAAEGIRLTSFYTGAPVCTPSRAALLTGRFPIRFGMANNVGPDSPGGLPAEERTLAEALRSKGYRTAAFGKWHLGSVAGHFPTEHGFDEYLGLLYSNDMIPPWVRTERPMHLYRNTTPTPEQPVDQQTSAVGGPELTHPGVSVHDRRLQKDLFVEIGPDDPGRAVGVELEELEVEAVEEGVRAGDDHLSLESRVEERELFLVRRQADCLSHLGVDHVSLDEPLGAVEQDLRRAADELALFMRQEHGSRKGRDRFATELDTDLELPLVDVVKELLSPVGVLTHPAVAILDSLFDLHAFRPQCISNTVHEAESGVTDN